MHDPLVKGDDPTLLADAIHNKALKQYLRCEPLQPLFKVR